LALVLFRSTIYSDGIKGAILLSFLSVIYLWRGYEFPFSFEAEEALIFFLLSLAAIFFLVASLDMLIIYFSIDLQGLCFYTLCVLNRYANGATEAAIKYLLMSGLASSLLLFGTSLRYGETGTTNLSLWLELQAPGIPILASTLWESSCQRLDPEAPNISIIPLSITLKVRREHRLMKGITRPWLIVKEKYH
jgi:NADH:ubiquinone oxidoreductase subunit 2 (subunit N)